ncbi:collagenase [Roseateles sp. NT4]|uniref:M9 family metallopeptidase n=1 Tax=Roseateles sp. NT4 TaxID=3453715 RepID=UPI003EED79F0
MKTLHRLATSLALGALATLAAAHDDPKQQAPRPSQRSALPPSPEQAQYQLQTAPRDAAKLVAGRVKALAARPCEDMSVLAGLQGSALADYIANLPAFDCHYGLFSLSGTRAASVFSAANVTAVAQRFAQEAASYDATNIRLVNLTLYLRAGYYLASGGSGPALPAAVRDVTRNAIGTLIDNGRLMRANTPGYTTAGEVMTLITNQNDELYYMPRLRSLVTRFTNTPSNPSAVQALSDRTVGAGFTGALTVMYYVHWRDGAAAVLQNDPSYTQALYGFVRGNRAALLGTANDYQLNDALREALRYGQYPALLPTVSQEIRDTLANSRPSDNSVSLWAGAAEAVSYYDNANCASYGTCNYKTTLADAVLKFSQSCSSTIRVRAQALTAAQFSDTCGQLAAEETYAHTMLKTQRKPVANDNNSALEVVVFDDYANYQKYASLIYGISTDNGGMYLEGNPADAANQARFVAYKATWLPDFQIWNLKHEYIHYIDGRFDMVGDFALGTSKPTVWWIEGIAEYISLGNNNQAAIDAARTAQYKLSDIFGNTYDMADYVNRAYRWGYMATRFMVERHRSDVDANLALFRVGDYAGYQARMQAIGTRYDAEFASWVASATTAGQPPLPTDSTLPACSGDTRYLGRNCTIALPAGTVNYLYLRLPAGASNVRIASSGGTGDLSLAVDYGRWPTATQYLARSWQSGTVQSVSINQPGSSDWYYVVLGSKDSRASYSGVSIAATYDLPKP